MNADQKELFLVCVHLRLSAAKLEP